MFKIESRGSNLSYQEDLMQELMFIGRGLIISYICVLVEDDSKKNWIHIR